MKSAGGLGRWADRAAWSEHPVPAGGGGGGGGGSRSCARRDVRLSATRLPLLSAASHAGPVGARPRLRPADLRVRQS